jgi:hypothetical protein
VGEELEAASPALGHADDVARPAALEPAGDGGRRLLVQRGLVRLQDRAIVLGC